MTATRSSGPVTATLADATVDALLRNEVRVVFGIGGTHTLPLLGAIERSGLTFVGARTELGAAYMAIGYARASGRAAVALTSTGPGALNAVSALQDAQWSSIPLIHLTTSVGGPPGAGFAGAVHETPAQHELLRLAGKDCVRLAPDDPYPAIGSAVRLAHEQPRGPVTVEIPAGCWPTPVVPPRDEVRTPEPATAPPGVAELAEALHAARRPVFFAGAGALARDGGRAVMELAEHLHAPVVTSYQGKTIADQAHPLNLGPWASESAVRDVVAQADVAVVFGSKLSALGTAGWQLPLPARTYRVDLNGRTHPRYPQLRELPADAASVATELRARLDPKPPWAPEGVPAEVIEGARKRSDLAMRYVDALGAPELFAADMSKAGFWAMKFLSTGAPSVQAFSSYLAMGTALPMAIGMTVARRRPAVVVVGDGGLQMSLAELATIAEHRLPITLVVIVDGAYGMLRDNSATVDGSTDLGLTLWNPDLGALAGSFGIPHADVRSPEELDAILAGGGDGPRMVLVHDTFPPDLVSAMAEVPMVAALRRHAEERPNAPAVTVDGLTVTFAELDERAEVVGHALAREGIGPGDRVTIALPNSHAFMAAVIATLKLGATPQPLAARLPRAECENIIALADPKLVIGVDPADHPGRRCITDLAELCIVPHNEPLPRLPLQVSSQWKVTTSGGSTGQPKLIVGTAPAIVDDTTPPGYLLPTDSVVLIPGPLYHTAPYAISVLALVHGNHLLLERRFDAEATVWLIARYRPTFALLVPTMMQRIWRLPAHVRDVDMTSLRTVFHMASHCPAWLKRAWIDWLGPDRIFELYGASDSATNTVIGGREWLAHPGSVGRVRQHTRPGQGETMITDDTGRALAPGEVGEIWMRPAPGSTPRSIVIGAQPRERDGWVSVGDLGWIDADGYLYIAERRNDLIVTGGENVYPAEVEGALDSHPGVRSSVVIGLPDDDLGQRVHALVEVREGVTEAELRAHMTGQLARYKTPRSYELLNRPLRDDAGKVRKSALVAARSAGTVTEGR